MRFRPATSRWPLVAGSSPQHAEGGLAWRRSAPAGRRSRRAPRTRCYGGEIAEAAHQVAHHTITAVAAVPGARRPAPCRPPGRAAARTRRHPGAGAASMNASSSSSGRAWRATPPSVQRARIRVRWRIAHRAAWGTASTISASASIRRACNRARRVRRRRGGKGQAARVRSGRRAFGQQAAWCMTKTWAQRSASSM